ncbi:MAG: hydrogenase accessory protein HypB [Candidatus Xenobia bacterium]
MKPRILELREGILKKNDELARALRERFARAGVRVVNLVSSPGSGKTLLLEATLKALAERGKRVAALTGDLQTDNDARRLARSGAPVRQISTGGTCHLEADMIERHLEGWSLEELDFLFIENVGNLVCTSSYDLGESLRAVLLSTTEGEDKPAKYPPLFSSADVFVITKLDLAEAAEFDRESALRALREIRPQAPVYETSAKRGLGLESWVDYLCAGA